ncbi:hypothetical protein [Nocardia sp. NBC_01388]|uniref:hypothetical protein n=1 Tax=Nocardia sp. NBC_01388 TaxID=2903596 RepID=UPI003251D943
MSDNTSDDPPGGANATGPARNPSTDRQDQVRRLYASKFDVPQELRGGALAHQFGIDDLDTVHASKLKAVQNAAFLRAAWMSHAVENDLDIGDRKHRWAMFVNGVGEDLHLARTEATHAGIELSDIEQAEYLGGSGVSWAQQPAHRQLGRLEHLSEQLFHADTRSAGHLEQIHDLRQQLETAHAAIDELGNHLTHNDTTIRVLLEQTVDADWQGPGTGRQMGSGLESLNTLREANEILATENAGDSCHTAAHNDQHLVAGRGISAAVDVALADPDPSTEHGEDPFLGLATPGQPGAEPDPQVEP